MAMPEIIRLEVSPYPDRQRVRVLAEIADAGDPPPHLQLSINDPRGREVAEMLVMSVFEACVELTLHMRPPAPADEILPYTARGRLFSGMEGQEEQTLHSLEKEFYLAEI